jgi:uncharacterized protein YeaO (DUF488 family)
MSVHIVQLGSPRIEEEGIRIGTVRRPPRGVQKSEFSRKNYYDVWFPNLAPSAETMKLGKAASTTGEWARFVRKYKSEMKEASAQHDLQLLAKLSQTTNFSVGCYCEDETHCHRSILKELLIKNGAKVE